MEENSVLLNWGIRDTQLASYKKKLRFPSRPRAKVMHQPPLGASTANPCNFIWGVKEI